MNLTSHYIKIFKIISKNYRWFTLGFAGVSAIFIICSALNSLIPVLLRNAANTLDGAESAQTQFLFFAGSYAVLWTASQVLSNIRGIFSAWVLAKCDATLYEAIISRIFRYSYKKQQTLDPGYVVADISRSSGSFSLVTIGIFWTIIPIAIEMLIAVCVLYKIMGAAYAMLFLVACIALTSISIYVAKSSSNIHKNLFEAENNLSSYTIERLSRVYDIKLNNSLTKELSSGKSFFNSYVKTIRNANIHMGIRVGCQGLAIGATLAFFVILAGVNYRANFTAGDFVMVAGYITMFTMQLHILAGTLINLQANFISLNDGIKYIEEDIKESHQPKQHKNAQSFALHGVSLVKNQKTILNNIDCQFGPGVNIISGRSGAGKTTLINTLLGFEDNYTGKAFYKGHLINESLSEYILSEVSVAPQKPILLPGTLKDNLLYGTENANPQKLIQIFELLELSRKGTNIEASLATIIDISGSGLSGGERQRIAIGRAILREKPTLILDEPTSALDKRMAQRIIEWLASNTPCLIIVTHDENLKKKYGTTIELDDRTIKVA
ncbi:MULTISPECIES: ATP-binding cassette domain-containing protein [Pseudomonas]|uniref:ABC transporter ATP-binding protein/permease n=1 Tax=Pseudomonas aphyarum TaxID=2942629 RepID=A0ABT5PH48_9PSED|nr:ABC transporter ATP-binding protein [Pseudomonas aphyarum]MDD0967829.1 ABC transporter ATP-binding protein/permease [Pseudomonas aphyarum]MDD1123140.1 ABC transporter ATP-binding protein/permease [Pseudomonas aphyarum]